MQILFSLVFISLSRGRWYCCRLPPAHFFYIGLEILNLKSSLFSSIVIVNKVLKIFYIFVYWGLETTFESQHLNMLTAAWHWPLSHRSRSVAAKTCLMKRMKLASIFWLCVIFRPVWLNTKRKYSCRNWGETCHQKMNLNNLYFNLNSYLGRIELKCKIWIT